jgi:hypothetical protein
MPMNIIFIIIESLAICDYLLMTAEEVIKGAYENGWEAT